MLVLFRGMVVGGVICTWKDIKSNLHVIKM